MQIAIAILLALALAGGVSAAARESLPGDALYRVKTGLNEEVRQSLAVTAEAKARVEADLAQRRLEEAEELAADATLRGDVQSQLEANFTAFADRVEARVEEFESKGELAAAAEVIADFETALLAHEEILTRLEVAADGAEERTALSRLSARAKSEAEQAARLRARIEAKIASGESTPAVRAAAEGRLRAALNKISETRRFIANAEARLGSDKVAAAKARLRVAETAVVEGKAKLDAGEHGEAFVLFSAAHGIAQQAQMLITAELDLRVDVDGDDGRSDARIQADAEAHVEGRADDANVDSNLDHKTEAEAEARVDLDLDISE